MWAHYKLQWRRAKHTRTHTRTHTHRHRLQAVTSFCSWSFRRCSSFSFSSCSWSSFRCSSFSRSSCSCNRRLCSSFSRSSCSCSSRRCASNCRCTLSTVSTDGRSSAVSASARCPLSSLQITTQVDWLRCNATFSTTGLYCALKITDSHKVDISEIAESITFWRMQ